MDVPITRQIGLGNALELCRWGDTQITVQRALEIDWAQRVVPMEDLMAVAMQYADRTLDMAPCAVRNVKQMIYRGAHMDPLEGQRFGSALIQNLAGMQDGVEGASLPGEASPQLHRRVGRLRGRRLTAGILDEKS